MRAGFAKNDITPRVGVELCGFGPYRCRHSIAVRDRLWARAMAIEQGAERAVVVSCDLVGLPLAMTHRVREIVGRETGLSVERIMIQCTHTHSGPATGTYTGWGQPDAPYLETLPQRIAVAAIGALGRLEETRMLHAESPCEGMGLNREGDRDAPPLDDVLAADWRPAKPELTDTVCHVLRFESVASGRVIGFASYFGCHPVVCCSATRYIHGDFCGVAMNLLERERPGSVGLFLQGAQGDVNSCVVHKPEQESLLALDVIAARFANGVRAGLESATEIDAEPLACVARQVSFTRRPWTLDEMRRMLDVCETRLHRLDVTDGYVDADWNVCMETVKAVALRRLIAEVEVGVTEPAPTELIGVRIGPVALLGAPLEIFQAIKNEVRAKALAPIPLVMGCVSDTGGYAPDHTSAASRGYAADTVPMIRGDVPYANIHEELVGELLALDGALFGPR